MSVDEVMHEVKKDRAYYDKSGGGVTASGGESLLNPVFLHQLFKRCVDSKIHTTLESALNIPIENLKTVLPLTGLLIADLKHHNSEKHHHITGSGNKRILENLKFAAKNHNRIWIRIPLIPGINDDEDNLKKSAELINFLGSSIKRVELLKYNNLYGNKYTSLDIHAPMTVLIPQTDEEMANKVKYINGFLKDIDDNYCSRT